MKISRVDLLNALESVSPGLASRDMIEQGACVVFKDGAAHTYNDEIYCRFPLPGIAFSGAVPLAPMRAILSKLKDDEIEIDVDAEAKQLKASSKGRSFGIHMELDIHLAIDKVESPDKFRKLPESFTEAIIRLASCASTDSQKYHITCVQMTKKWAEATDNNQAMRYDMGLPLQEPILVRASSLRHLKMVTPRSMAVTKSWIHFKNEVGLRISIRRDADTEDKFPNISKVLEFTGDSITLSKGISEACERAEVFSSEDAEQNMVQVTLRTGKPMIIRGTGVSGWYREPRKVDYSGPDITFMISPALLAALVTESLPTKVCGNRLIMKSESLSYCVALEQEKKDTEPSEEE